jgi:hypothetical protein
MNFRLRYKPTGWYVSDMTKATPAPRETAKTKLLNAALSVVRTKG